jgi:hypothetical protein
MLTFPDGARKQRSSAVHCGAVGCRRAAVGLEV